MSRKRPAFWWLLAGPLVVVSAVLYLAFPFLAITETSGGKTLVVEGWMDPGALQQAAQLALDSGYTKVYTTGTVRAFSYYLEPREAVLVTLHDPQPGRIIVDVSGTTGAGFYLITGNDTLLDQVVGAQPRVFSCDAGRNVEQLRIEAWDIPMEPGTPEIFIRMLDVNGKNAHLLQRASEMIRPDSTIGPGRPTYAHSARADLIGFGVPADRITAVPAFGDPPSRSWANAHAFSLQAHAEGITACDVATVGVHARRSRALFQTACGPDIDVGVIALHDPFCTRANWWTSWRGWYTLLKEVLGAPEAQAVEATR
ncbi:MAG: hypothetical protein IPL86_01820 [Flavobacteriales bacterium]|jgi:hypothetical protein|nr:hypothetical protein [Flavobacteriales bacterium]